MTSVAVDGMKYSDAGAAPVAPSPPPGPTEASKTLPYVPASVVSVNREAGVSPLPHEAAVEATSANVRVSAHVFMGTSILPQVPRCKLSSALALGGPTWARIRP